MPYTRQQQKLFHELEENLGARKHHGVSEEEARKLADEADKLARAGKTKPAKKAFGFIDLTLLW